MAFQGKWAQQKEEQEHAKWMARHALEMARHELESRLLLSATADLSGEELRQRLPEVAKGVHNSLAVLYPASSAAPDVRSVE